MLRAAGTEVWRVGFNAGDQAFWPDKSSYIPYIGQPEDWPAEVQQIIAAKGITDLVLYGDVRPIHAEAVSVARAAGVTVHVFEEGYLRPYWVTYERGGSNGHSRLMHISVPQMKRALARAERDPTPAPGHWGDMRQHVFYGALYHGRMMVGRRRYPNFRRHRELTVPQEFWLYFKRLALMPLHWLSRIAATRRVLNGGYPYHLVLMQLDHDSSFIAHSPFERMEQFIEQVIAGFAKGALPHHHLVFKAHPLESGRHDLKGQIERLAEAHGIDGRVHYLRGGKLAKLLNPARSAVTVNSTAAQQVLWRGQPLRVFGAAVFDKPEFVSTQPLPEFFARPDRPDRTAYGDYRQYLLETSQVAGGFYSARGRRQLLRHVVDMMLAPLDPYDALEQGQAAPRPRMQVVTSQDTTR